MTTTLDRDDEPTQVMGLVDTTHPIATTSVRAPSVVSKGDAANGLIYTFENVKDPSGADPWYWTAIDERTGKVAWKQQAGHGGLYNNHYAGIAIGSNPRTKKTTLYLGGVGGVMALRDG